MRVRACLLCLLVLTLPSACRSAPSPTTNADVTVGRWRVTFSPDRGVALSYGGVPITRQSSLYLVKPGWTALLYDQRAVPPAVTVGATPDGAGRVITIQSQNADAVVGDIITLSADGAVTVDMAYALTHDVPAEMEYAAGYLSAPLLAGMPYAAETAAGPRSGVVPYTTPSLDQSRNMFVPSFRRLTLPTRLGVLEIAVSGDWPDFVCFDARRDPQAWAQEAPIFWMGLGVTPHALSYGNGKTFHVVTRYHLTPLAPSAPVPTVTRATGALQSLAEARVPASRPPCIVPTAKAITLTGRRLRLSRRTRLVIAAGATPQDKQTAATVAQGLATRFGLPGLRIVRADAVTTPDDVLVFGEPSRVSLVARLLAHAGAVSPTRPQGYALRVGAGWAVVGGHDPAGTRYGAQTLIQLLGRDVHGPFVWGARIDDYPALAWRGAHLFVGDHALPFHKRLIRDVFARLKLNNLVLQCEQARWQTIGRAAPRWAMSKADLRREIAFANAYGLTVTPLINSVGHMEWLFGDPTRGPLAEDPQTPYAANVTNPETYRFLFRLYDEVQDVFHSQYLHIGGDEVTMRGRYPMRSLPTYPTVAEAFTAHVRRVHDYLHQRGMQTMIWGDMLLAPGETQDATSAPDAAQAAQMRAGLPKDIAIADWHYTATGDFSSPEKFRQAGYEKVLGATWSNAGNIAAFARKQIADRQWGLLQTTWAGFNSSAQNLADDPQQFYAFVLAAEYAWSGTRIDPDRLPYNPARVFMALYDLPPVDPRVCAGFAVDLSGVADRALADSVAGNGWLGYGPAHDLSRVPLGISRFDGLLYDLRSRVVMLQGAFNPSGGAYPERVVLPVHRPATTLALLLTTAYAASPQAPVGQLTVGYADGTTRTVPLIYGRNIAAWDDGQDTPAAPVVWQGRTAAGDPIFLRALTWTNPQPHKTITSVTLATTDPVAAPTLFALTGLAP